MQGSYTRSSRLSPIAKMRVPLTLVPWRMRGRLVALTVASIVIAGLDMLGVLAMMPLMQLLTTPQGLPPLVQDYIVPVVGTDRRTTLLLYTALFIGLMFIVKNICMVWLRWRSIGVMSRATAAAQAEMLRRYVHADYLSHRRRSASDIIQTVTGSVNSALTGVVLAVIATITDLVTAVVLLAALVALAPAASVVAIVVFGGAAILMLRVLKPYALKFGLQSLELNTHLWKALNPAIEGFRESRIFGRENLFVERFRVNRLAMIRPQRAQQVLGELPRFLMEIVMIFGVLVIAILLFATRPESEAFGLLAVFAAASIRVAPALNRSVANINGIRANLPALDRVIEQMDELDAGAAALPIRVEGMSIPDGDIVVDGVSFHYPDSSTNVLTDIGVTIPRGHTVALVGSSGAGKTTFADLILGLFTPTTGTITASGIDIAQHPYAWRDNVAAVSQRVYLWDASIRDLITFGQSPEDVDDQFLHHVVEQAQLTELVASLPEGLDTYVGEGGARISGGQAQRIGIARALYSRPHVLVLDEATSALDNETEHQITATLEALHGEITIIVVAHRLSTVRHADEILFFSQGRLADRGTMGSLQQTSPEFARLVELGQLA